jgi:SAM-dependent methyltransferase
MWDDRYASDDYRFGTRPNNFLVDCAALLNPEGTPATGSRALSLGEGEGRNAVYLAQLGYDVTAVDQSAVGNAKAHRLAGMKGVTITTVTADLNDFVIEPASWDVIIDFFCHMPQPERVELHRRVIDGLKPGGAYIYEIFTPRQLELATGGPTTRDLVVSLEQARRELAGLDLRIARELVRRRDEDDPDSRLQAVLQILGIKVGEVHEPPLQSDH